MQTRLIQLLLSTALLCACGPIEATSGRPRIVDGDSLEIAGESIRLFGIDAPEARQLCGKDGGTWACGAAATRRLQELIGADPIVCSKRDTDSYGRTVARCMNGEVDLAAELARAGLALAYRDYSSDYIDEEAEAQAARRGIWSGEFQAPWDYRRNAEPAAAQPAPRTRTTATDAAASGDCTIKGNINREGVRIYHVPGSSSYAATLIDVARGERWFCSEQEARDAGWRAPRG